METEYLRPRAPVFDNDFAVITNWSTSQYRATKYVEKAEVFVDRNIHLDCRVSFVGAGDCEAIHAGKMLPIKVFQFCSSARSLEDRVRHERDILYLGGTSNGGSMVQKRIEPFKVADDPHIEYQPAIWTAKYNSLDSGLTLALPLYHDNPEIQGPVQRYLVKLFEMTQVRIGGITTQNLHEIWAFVIDKEEPKECRLEKLHPIARDSPV